MMNPTAGMHGGSAANRVMDSSSDRPAMPTACCTASQCFGMRVSTCSVGGGSSSSTAVAQQQHQQQQQQQRIKFMSAAKNTCSRKEQSSTS